jgi:hypothetical protein
MEVIYDFEIWHVVLKLQLRLRKPLISTSSSTN